MQNSDQWNNDTRLEYEERAGIMEYCGGLPRAEAERQAREIINSRFAPPPAPPKQHEQLGLDMGRQFFSEIQRMFQ